jgi:hypothetical protein
VREEEEGLEEAETTEEVIEAVEAEAEELLEEDEVRGREEGRGSGREKFK